MRNSTENREIVLDFCTPDPFRGEVPNPYCEGLMKIECGAFDQGKRTIISDLKCTSDTFGPCLNGLTYEEIQELEEEEPCNGKAINSKASPEKYSLIIAVGSALLALFQYAV